MNSSLLKSGIIGSFLFLAFFLLSMVLSSCKHEPLVPKGSGGNDDDTTGTGIPCDPNVVYFNQQVLPILVSSCAKSGCHDAGSAQDGVILNSYSNVMTTGDVTPFNLGDSEIWEVINETDPDKQMPPPGENPLTSDQINLIGLWINQGAQSLACDDNLGPCDSINVSLSANVNPVLQAKCVGCHTSATASNNNVNLSNYTGIAAVAANGQLATSITHTGSFNMPKGGPKLSDCEIAKMLKWIADGYPNN